MSFKSSYVYAPYTFMYNPKEKLNYFYTILVIPKNKVSTEVNRCFRTALNKIV